MPRPKELEDSVVVPIVLTRRLKEEAEEAARRLGFRSLSALIRAALSEYLKTHVQAAPGTSSSTQPSLDPLVEAELADFRDALEKLEKSVRELEYRAQPLARALASGTRVLSSEDYRLKVTLSNSVIQVKKRWYSLRRWYSRLRKDDVISAKMAELLRRLHALEKLTS